MTLRIASWNVQWCRGVDGVVDPVRIAVRLKELGHFDVVCLQEVASGFGDLPGSAGEDQVALLAEHLPGLDVVYGAAVDLDDGEGGRARFGNALFSHYPVLQIFRHLLPWPADPAVPSMQRMALEAVLDTPTGPLRVISTHLEYYSARQRAAQVEALRALHIQACGHAAQALRPAGEGPFRPLPYPRSLVLAGDFNCAPQAPEAQRLLEAFPGEVPALADAWTVAHPGVPHPPTAGVHMDNLPTSCLDRILVSADLVPRVAGLRVDAQTQASDHQPVLLELRAGPAA